MTTYTSSSLPKIVEKKLKKICAKGFSVDEAERYAYGYDNSRKHSMPNAVIFAENHQQIQDIIKICYEYSVPIVARGRGTGTTGGSIPLKKAIVLSLERMNRIIKVDPDNRMMIVEPGVTNAEVQRAAADCGFFWPPDPTSAEYCSIGGNLGFNAAGPKTVKYGSTRDNTLGLKAVTGTGDTLITGVRTSKGVVGYDLTRLLIGSEGTLAIITEATLKLTPLPSCVVTLQFIFDNIHNAATAVSAIMKQPATPCALEFMDKHSLDLVKNNPELNIPKQAGAMLIVEIDGFKSELTESITMVKTAAATNAGLISSQSATTPAEINALWAARKQLSPALRRIAPKKINEDVVVPVANIPALIEYIENLSLRYQIPIVNFGHAGNGNIHVNLLIDPSNKIQMENETKCLSDLFDKVLALEGTLSGEHGVGIEKRDYIDREILPVALNLMRQIKSSFDPKGILNPDKIFPLE